MSNQSRSYVPIVAALITGGATLTAALIANWDKLFPDRPADSTEITATADASPSTGTTETPRPTPTPLLAQLEGVYDFVDQNFEPKPSSSRMQITRVAATEFRWSAEGVFGGVAIRSRGELVGRPDGWLMSVDESDEPSVVTRGKIPIHISFDGSLLTIAEQSGSRGIQWRKR